MGNSCGKEDERMMGHATMLRVRRALVGYWVVTTEIIEEVGGTKLGNRVFFKINGRGGAC